MVAKEKEDMDFPESLRNQGQEWDDADQVETESISGAGR